MEDRTITLIDNEGKEVVCDILFTYHYDKLNRNYVVFMDRASRNVSASEYIEGEGGNGKLNPVQTDEEWSMLEDLLNDYVAQMDGGKNGGSCGSCGCEGGCESCQGCGSCDEECDCQDQ
ncbi:MAG: DUF1292 domain-containing protein [Acholeplasmatales bacterium]|nr:DUF1292 domain-containing protein [Acholeplasmatales bacterium]